MDTLTLVVRLLTALPELINIVRDVRDEIDKDETTIDKVRDLLDAAEQAIKQVEETFPAAARTKD